MAAKVVIPEWVISCLEQYGNCACGRKLVEKYGEKKLLDHLDKIGYPCELEILSDNKDEEPLPKDGTYILTLKNLPSSVKPDVEEKEVKESKPKKAAKTKK